MTNESDVWKRGTRHMPQAPPASYNRPGADLGEGAPDMRPPIWLVVMWLFARLQNTSTKHVDHQEDWRLFSKRIETNNTEKKGWVEETQIQKHQKQL